MKRKNPIIAAVCILTMIVCYASAVILLARKINKTEVMPEKEEIIGVNEAVPVPRIGVLEIRKEPDPTPEKSADPERNVPLATVLENFEEPKTTHVPDLSGTAEPLIESPTPDSKESPSPDKPQTSFLPITTETGKPDVTTPCPHIPDEFRDDYKKVIVSEGFSWDEKVISGVTVRDNYVIPEGVPSDESVRTSVDTGENKTLALIPIGDPDNGYRTDYRPGEKLISSGVEDYLKNQKSSNAYSHVRDPYEIIGSNMILEGLPFLYVPGFIAGTCISKTVIDFQDADGDGLLAAVYEKCDERRADLWGLKDAQREEDFPVAVYVDCGNCTDARVKSCVESRVSRYFYDKKEIHCGVEVTRMAEVPDSRSDYYFLAFPLLDGKYVVNLAGGIILLNRAPERSLHIYFDNGGGDLGFFNLQIAVDGKVVYETERFNINGTSVVTKVY